MVIFHGYVCWPEGNPFEIHGFGLAVCPHILCPQGRDPQPLRQGQQKRDPMGCDGLTHFVGGEPSRSDFEIWNWQRLTVWYDLQCSYMDFQNDTVTVRTSWSSKFLRAKLDHVQDGSWPRMPTSACACSTWNKLLRYTHLQHHRLQHLQHLYPFHPLYIISFSSF